MKAHLFNALFTFALIIPRGNVEAETFTCTRHQNGDEMTYTISDETRSPDVNVSECDYLWINGSNITIADHSGHISPVKSKSINSLTTSRCVEGLISTQECLSKTTGYYISYDTKCTESCTGNDVIPGKEGGMSTTLIAVIVSISGVLLAVLVFLGCKYKHKICRTSGLGQCGGRYANVKMANTNPKPSDVV